MFGQQPWLPRGARDINVCVQRGRGPYFHTFGTSLRPCDSFFGWEKMQSEMTAALQVCNGLSSSDAKPGICQSSTLTRKGATLVVAY